jgi:hypothetical protein
MALIKRYSASLAGHLLQIEMALNVLKAHYCSKSWAENSLHRVNRLPNTTDLY